MSKRNRYQKRDTATLERSKRSGLALASMASYDGAMPDKTRMMSNRIGTNPNSAYAQQQRVTLMWQAEDLVKNSDWVSVCYSLKQYCQPIGYLAQTGDPALDSEVNQYMREVMKRGGINQSALSAFSCAAHVEMPVRGDSILERYDDETQLRFIVRCADQIGELYRFVNPASYGAEAFVQPPAPSVRYIAGIFLAPNGMNEAFKIYERGYNQTYLNPQIVPACNVIYFQDNLFDGHRGVSKFAPAIQSIQKRNKIWQSGMDSMAIQSKIAAIASNASGSPDPLDYETTTNSDGTITYTEKMADGAVVKYQFSDGDSYQFMKSEAPGPALLQGLDYSDERTCLSLGFPKAFLISARDGGGAPTRFDMSRAGREIMRLRNDVYLPRLEKMAYLFLMDGIARKKLPARAGVLNGNWHWPSLPTADAFRDDKSDVEAMRAGLTTRTAIIAKNGDGTFEDVLARGTQEAIAIEMATQDANRELVRRGYKPTVADLNIAQDTANPTQQPEPAPEANKPQGEAPANATAALAFDEGKHPRADDGKFGSGGGGAKKEPASPNEPAAKGEGGKAEEMGAGDGKWTAGGGGSSEKKSPSGITFRQFDTVVTHLRKEFSSADSHRAHVEEKIGAKRGATGLIDDESRKHPEWIDARKKSEQAFQNLKAFNAKHVKHFSKEIRAQIDKKRQDALAARTATAALAFDESKHPRAKDGEFGSGGGGGGGKADETGEGADGKPKKVSEMSKGELKTHGMRKKLEALRAKNAEGAKKLADTNARVSELHSQLVEQLNAGTGTANDDLKKTVNELGAKIAETKMHTKTIQHALRGEDIAADEHGQDSPEHEAARKRTEYVAKLADFDEGKHPRADDGKFGSGGGKASPNEPSAKTGEKTKPKSNRPPPAKKAPACDERCQRAKKAHVMVDKTIQRYAEEHNEPRVAKALGGVSFPNGEPIDIAIAGDDGVVKHGVELKTMVANSNGKITMKGDAIARKKAWERKNKATIHTVVIDDSAVMNANGEGKHDESKRKIYYANGYGSFRIGSLHEVKGGMDEVKQLMNTPYKKLPPGAQKR